MSVKTVQGDAELLTETRHGNAVAYGGLRERHAPAARILARLLVDGPAEAEEAVAETFAGILHLLRRGGGPREAFRPYLLTALRRTVHDRSQGRGGWVTDGEASGPWVPFVDPALSGLERSPVARAFLSLPERWRLVLWHAGVEGAGPAEIAPLLGMPAGGVTALVHVAREGWRQACLRAHLAGTPRQECRPVLGMMGVYVRGGLARRESRPLDEHMDGCAECHDVFLELADVNQGLRVIVGPLVAGPALPGYLAALDRAGGTGAAGPFGRWRRAPASRRAVAAGAAVGAVSLAAALAAVLVPVSAQGPQVPSAAAVPEPVAGAPTPAPAPVPGPQDPPSPPLPPSPEPSPGKAEKPRRPDGPGAVAPPAQRGAVPAPRLIARIDALGALVRSEAGIVAVRLRNVGAGGSGELVADVGLPDGVTVLAAARRGRAVAAIRPVGTVDGWACRAGSGGARCFRRPLAAGRATAIFLRVAVSPTAAEGSAPSVRISAAGIGMTARARTGVRTAGAPARFATDGQVSTSAIGNTLMVCASVAPACRAARSRRGDRRDNDLWEMGPLDQDRDPSTRSSSAARLALPRRSKVVWAGLYWSAGAPADGRIKFKAPGDGGYTRVRAERVTERELPAGVGYQAFADVTRLMGRLPGTYWAADASLRPGVSRHAGWSLVVIAADSRQPYSQAVVVDTATVVDREHGPAWIPLDGLTPTAAPVRVDLVTWEGDAGLTGDRVTLGGRPLRPEAGDRDAGNAFDGSATGAEGTGMTFGTDVDGFRSTLGRNPVLKVSTGRDVLLFGAAVVRVRARS
ncbi:zf-HC2 domain-containing protein [Streptosporangium roseum]|uniref:RNA polymerase, sigma-24 subunit, ECF subfamily n=1 Tax=Streptosporangium roseum (strain ATCC 12428 / DSM 43021 / JCM 3005 / KCTC 9067 / NCIMB 10171 / NRRL 2505 / NI 9100) TaxID=479432 RepID=D2B119_STRRD|nr:zf-HC2 domain-containing protein [Streptosporangium roseum]ACZ83426.1 RNA polymerase, sigma-24 subunit, ECF subfamily [Streptosporangium roseum DSM 43021]